MPKELERYYAHTATTVWLFFRRARASSRLLVRRASLPELLDRRPPSRRLYSVWVLTTEALVPHGCIEPGLVEASLLGGNVRSFLRYSLVVTTYHPH